MYIKDLGISLGKQTMTPKDVHTWFEAFVLLELDDAINTRPWISVNSLRIVFTFWRHTDLSEGGIDREPISICFSYNPKVHEIE